MLFQTRITQNYRQLSAIEDDFPFVEISEIAEIESWRKEIYRPIYHTHKWWAKRLGSVFRAIILGAALPANTDIIRQFYEPVQLPDLVVFDPFMGSGTTVGEAYKLGCKTIGRDINPVAYNAVKSALGSISREELIKAYQQLENEVSEKLLSLYRSKDNQGRPCEVLYYFWVKTLPCPCCSAQVDLFSKFIFASHAYPKIHKEARAVCPQCGSINLVEYGSQHCLCSGCGWEYNPSKGWARRTTAKCPECSSEFKIAETVRKRNMPPDHRMYAKLVLSVDGEKEYLPITENDRGNYQQASARLRETSAHYPVVEIPDGYNTNQVLNYGYKYWHEMFNDRQLLGLSTLARGIAKIEDEHAKNALAILFSGVLEFNNMFASYKGEGTGAVRHMFSHHILKPERTPLEANIWGTPRSSGSFSTLFKSRLLRAIDYKNKPFELKVGKKVKRKSGRKVFGLSKPIFASIQDRYPIEGLGENEIYLSCGSSANIDLPSNSVDFIITDPPFFDNVHYSELADFFYVWQAHHFLSQEMDSVVTTRHPEEVQSTDSVSFTKNLQRVFKECNRVLKDQGLLVFSYHHSREEGWASLAEAVMGAGYEFVQAYPIRSEMSVAVPKSQTKQPINYDIILVCRKCGFVERRRNEQTVALNLATVFATFKVAQLNKSDKKLSKGDIRIILYSELLVFLSHERSSKDVVEILQGHRDRCEQHILDIYTKQKVDKD